MKPLATPLCPILAITMVLTGCAPRDPVDRMFYDIGYQGRDGLTKPHAMADDFEPFSPFSYSPSEYKEGCGAYLYVGPGTPPAILPRAGLHPTIRALHYTDKERLALKPAERARLDLTRVKEVRKVSPSYKIMLKLFPELNLASLDASSYKIRVDPDVAARRIIGELGLPRFAFSHNIRGCHTGVTLVYAPLSHPTIAINKSIEVNDMAGRPVGSCNFPSMQFSFSLSQDNVIVNYGDTLGGCYVDI